MFDQMGGEIQTYDTFLMSCYLWKVYTSRYSEKSDGEETTLYIASDGDSFVRTGADHKEIWYENFEVFPQGVFLAVHLPEKFADESIYTIAAAALLYLKVYKRAMECQRKYLARKETINDEA